MPCICSRKGRKWEEAARATLARTDELDTRGAFGCRLLGSSLPINLSYLVPS